MLDWPLKMTCIYYKFDSQRDSNTITFNGLCLTVKELKNRIMAQNRLKVKTGYLQILNAQTLEGQLSADALLMCDTSVRHYF